MTHVDIYLETSSIFQGITDRKCGYVLSVLVHNEEKTREGFGHYKGNLSPDSSAHTGRSPGTHDSTFGDLRTYPGCICKQ